MPYWACILQRETTGRYYCGFSMTLNAALPEHRIPEYRGSKTISTDFSHTLAADISIPVESAVSKTLACPPCPHSVRVRNPLG